MTRSGLLERPSLPVIFRPRIEPVMPIAIMIAPELAARGTVGRMIRRFVHSMQVRLPLRVCPMARLLMPSNLPTG